MIQKSKDKDLKLLKHDFKGLVILNVKELDLRMFDLRNIHTVFWWVTLHLSIIYGFYLLTICLYLHICPDFFLPLIISIDFKN